MVNSTLLILFRVARRTMGAKKLTNTMRRENRDWVAHCLHCRLFPVSTFSLVRYDPKRLAQTPL